MALYNCYYYNRANGKSPVREFIDSLDVKTRNKFFFKKSLLEKFGHKLPEPHASYLKDGIFELRFKGAEGHIRILYFFFCRKKIIFTNGFKKKTNRAPNKEIKLAKERMKDFLSRH